MKIKVKNNPQNKFTSIIEVNNQDWGVLPQKALQSFSNKNEFLLNTEDLTLLKQKIKKFALEKILNFIAYRERAVSEVSKYCRKLFLNKELEQEIVDYVVKKKYVDDHRFATLLTESVYRKGKNKIFAEIKLKEYSIAEKIIKEVIDDQYDTEKSTKLLIGLVDKAINRYSSEKSIYKKKEKCANYLIRRGFGYYDFIELLEKKIEGK